MLLKEYSGRCHCGAVSFRFRSEPIVRGCRCNCSICRRKGAVMSDHYVAPRDMLALEGRDSLRRYQFGDQLVNHYFCGRCGIHPFHEPVERPGHLRINLGCVEGLDVPGLEIRHIDGRSFRPEVL